LVASGIQGMRTSSEHSSVYGVIASIADIVRFPVNKTFQYISSTYTLLSLCELALNRIDYSDM